MKHWYTNGIESHKYDPEVDEIPNDYVPGCGFNKGKPSWNKGLTAEDDERVAANGAKTREIRLAKGNYNAWNKGLTAETDDRVAKNAENSKQGMLDKYGVKNPSQLDTYVPWNKGLTKETSDSVAKISIANTGKPGWNKGLHPPGHPVSQKTRDKISATHKKPEVLQKRFSTMAANGNLGKQSNTKAEQEVYEDLLKSYSPDDIIPQYFGGERFPFICDFYIKSEDMFIEVDGNWTHGPKPFNPEDPECLELLNKWISRDNGSNYYTNAIYTWTDLDVRKLNYAKQNNLNYKVIYNKNKR